MMVYGTLPLVTCSQENPSPVSKDQVNKTKFRRENLANNFKLLLIIGESSDMIGNTNHLRDQKTNEIHELF